MSTRYTTRKECRDRRHMRKRKDLSGTSGRPRLSICFTGKHAYAQFIDDIAGKTLASVSTAAKDFPGSKMKCVEKAALLGGIAAQKAQSAGIKAVVFDRGGFKYHGKVKSFADAARKAGLQF